MWAYRDWVVKAFNENLPFDQFTVWQLAGDLLPNPTPRPAHRDRLQPLQRDDRRGRLDRARSGSTATRWTARAPRSQAWLGLTAGCAVCHDHKFDPISSKEFYSLYAFFYSAADPALDGNVSTTGPFVKLPTPAQKAALEAAAKAEADGADGGSKRSPRRCRLRRPRDATRPPSSGSSPTCSSTTPSRSGDRPQHVAERRRLGGRPAVRREVGPARAAAGEHVLPRGRDPVPAAAGRRARRTGSSKRGCGSTRSSRRRRWRCSSAAGRRCGGARNRRGNRAYGGGEPRHAQRAAPGAGRWAKLTRRRRTTRPEGRAAGRRRSRCRSTAASCTGTRSTLIGRERAGDRSARVVPRVVEGARRARRRRNCPPS